MGIEITVFIPPHGQKTVQEYECHQDDAQFFKDMDAKLSTETLMTGVVVYYADLGFKEEGEPVEAMILVSPDLDSRDAFIFLHEECIKHIEIYGEK